MKSVLEDANLVKVQQEGGALLARLGKEESCVTLTQDYRWAPRVGRDGDEQKAGAGSLPEVPHHWCRLENSFV